MVYTKKLAIAMIQIYGFLNTCLRTNFLNSAGVSLCSASSCETPSGLIAGNPTDSGVSRMVNQSATAPAKAIIDGT